jgi:predicted small lipoprotein YifL
MQKLLVLCVALLAALSLAACAGKGPVVGKGKAPPPPVVTKG